MTVNAIGTGYQQSVLSAEATSLNEAVSSELGRDEFLTLLIAQLQNQDPLNPMESQEFASQLAQFSSLEQLFDVNEGLSAIKEAIQAQESDNSLDYVGKTVKSYSNTIFKKDGNIDACTYYLDGAANVAVTIFDENGNTVFSVQDGWKEAGEHTFNWDGLNTGGSQTADGTYTFEVSATDGNGFEISTSTYVVGEVTGVNYTMGEPYLVIADRMIKPANVIEVTQQPNP